MPKGGNKTKKKKERAAQEDGAVGGGPVLLTVPQSCPGDDSDSICSSIPDSVLSDEVSEGVDESSDSSSDTELQFQLSEHLDQLGDKNSRTRLAALSYLNDALRHKMVVHFLMGRMETLIDAICKGLRKFHGVERQELLVLSSLCALQFGEEYPELCHVLQPVLISLLQDPSVNPIERSAALSTLSLCTFLLCQDAKQVEGVMHECEAVFHSSKTDVLVTSAIRGWAILLSIVPSHMISPILTSQLPQLTTVLNSSSDLSLKIAAGQAIALLFELAREVDEELLECDAADSACHVVQTIAAESNRYTGRKERSQQRSNFRDISQAVESGYVPERCIRFGVEQLPLDSWSKLVQYSVITDLLATGCRTHLQNNDLLRDVFQLGAPVLIQQESKANKIERKLYNAASAKWRSQSRGKQRDKRAVL